MNRDFSNKGQSGGLGLTGLCVTAGNKVLGFFFFSALYRPFVGQIMCIVGEYSAEEEVKRRGAH